MKEYKVENSSPWPGQATPCVTVNGTYVPFGSRYELRIRLREKFPELDDKANRTLADKCERAVKAP